MQKSLLSGLEKKVLSTGPNIVEQKLDQLTKKRRLQTMNSSLAGTSVNSENLPSITQYAASNEAMELVDAIHEEQN